MHTHTHTYCVSLVVAGDVSVQVAHQYHGHHGRQEDSDEHRVDEAEPLHVALRGGAEDVVPTRRPADGLLSLYTAHT